MKKKVTEFVKQWGGWTKYCGKSKTLFIHSNTTVDTFIERAVLDTFGYGLPFKIAAQSDMKQPLF